MTGLDRDTSRSPDRTGVCRAGRGAPSQCEMVTGPVLSSPNQHDQERITAFRDGPGPDSRAGAHCATIFGDREEPSGESRSKGFGDVGHHQRAMTTTPHNELADDPVHDPRRPGVPPKCQPRSSRPRIGILNAGVCIWSWVC